MNYKIKSLTTGEFNGLHFTEWDIIFRTEDISENMFLLFEALTCSMLTLLNIVQCCSNGMKAPP